MKHIFITIFLLFTFLNAYAGDNIVIYRMGDRDQPVWSLLKKSFDSKGYNVSIYEKADNIDRHLETINRINRTNASLMLALNLQTNEKADVFIAFTDAKKRTGRFLTIEEVPGRHTDNSMILAKEVAASFGKHEKGISLFPLLGVDMPGIFVKIECTNEQADEMLNKLHEGIQKFMKRGQ